MKPTLLILAAGIGSRYGSLKQLDKLGPSGETIIDYSVYDAIRAGFRKVIFVIKENIEKEFREVFIEKLGSRIPVDYVLQEIDRIPPGFSIPGDRNKPWGTGHAILMAAEKIQEPFAVINADDFYGFDAFRELAAFYRDWNMEKKNNWCMVGYPIKNTLSEHGFVSRGVCKTNSGSFLADVVERTKIKNISGRIVFVDEEGNEGVIPGETLVSMNFWGFTPVIFEYLKTGFSEFLKQSGTDPKAEYYIPAVVNAMIKNGTSSVKVLKSKDKWFGITYHEDRQQVVDQLNQLVGKGTYPENLWK